MIVWCFNPVDTTHLFLWEKIALLAVVKWPDYGFRQLVLAFVSENF